MGELIIHSEGTEIDFRRGASVDKSIGGRDTMDFSTVVRANETIPLSIGDPVFCYIARDGQTDLDQMQLTFGGTVEEIVDRDESLGTGNNVARFVRYRCVDFNQLADRFLVTKQYENKTLRHIVNDLVDSYLSEDDVYAYMEESGPTIEEAVFPYVTVTEALDRLSELTGYAWNITYARTLEVFLRERNLSSLRITDNNRPYKSFTFTESRKDLRNRQYVRAGKQKTDTRTEKFKGDGETQTFTLTYPAATEPTIKVNGTEKSVGIRQVESTQDWFWSKGERQINQSDDNTALSSTDTLEVTYQGQYPVIVQATDTGSVSDRKAEEGGTGIYENVIDRPEINERGLALGTAEGLLNRFADAYQEVQFTLDLESESSDYEHREYEALQTSGTDYQELSTSFDFTLVRSNVSKNPSVAAGDVDLRVNEQDWHTIFSTTRDTNVNGGSGEKQEQVLPITGRRIEIDSSASKMDVNITVEGRPIDLRPGQLIHIELTNPSVSGDYLIQNIIVQERGDFEVDYQVSCISGEQYGGWQEYFRRTRQERKKFVIRENEVLVVLRRETETMTLSDDVTVDPHTHKYEVGTAEVGYSLVEGLPQ